jgi:amidohydrolase
VFICVKVFLEENKMNSHEIKDAVAARTEEIIAVRRDLHKHPEVAFKEFRTAKIVAEKLQPLGLDVLYTGTADTGVETGIIGVLKGGKPGKTVLVRADIDGLPIIEETPAEYKSVIHGAMHACGHDAHTAIGLAVASIFAERRDEIPGTIKFLFQPAEEIVSGAEPMVKTGVMKDVDACFAIHMGNVFDVGKVAMKSGASMAACDSLSIKVMGRGGHGSQPDKAIDPIVCAAAIISSLQTVLSREIPANDQIAFTFGTINGGFASNIIAPEVTFTGTVRSFNPKLREFVLKRIDEITTGIAAAMRCKAEVKLVFGTPACVNDPHMTTLVHECAKELVGEENVLDGVAIMGSDDMSLFLQEAPGCYFSIGSAKMDGSSFPHHHPGFDIVESSMPIGAQVMTKVVWEYLTRSKN